MKKTLLSILIASCSIIQAQIPCINGMAGDYPCNGYDLQVFIPCTDFEADNANDSWGCFHDQRGNRTIFHYFQCLSGKNFTINGLRVRGHNIRHSDIVYIHFGVDYAAQITVGKYAE